MAAQVADAGDAARAVGEGQRVATIAGASSPPALRSRSTAGIGRPPRTPAPPSTVSAPPASRRHRGAEQREHARAGRRRPGWSRSASRPTVTVPPATRAAARNGAALDRSGSMIDVASRRSGRAARSRRRVPDWRPRRRGERARRSSSRCAEGSAGARRCGVSRRPSSNRGAESSRPDTNWLDADASISSAPPVDRAGAVDGERQCAASVVVDVDAEQRAGRRWSCASGGAAPTASPSNATGPRASAATGGRKRITVPARPQSIDTPPSSSRGRDQQVGPVIGSGRPTSVDPGAESAQRLDHQGGVARVQGADAAGTGSRRGRRAPARGW